MSQINDNRGRLIITADDYGLCDSVNQAIEECLSAGTVRATCVMANMPNYRPAESLRRKFPQSSLGIHWNVTQGRSVLPCERVPSLVNGDGSFCKPSDLRRRWWSGRLKLNELQAELRAQFDRLVEITGPLDFWNTHQNSHVFPGLFQTFVNLGRELGIPAMRCHRRITTPRGSGEMRYHMSHPQYWLKGQVIAWWSSQAETFGTLMPDARIYTPGYREPEDMIKEVISRLPWSRIKTAAEVIIHPATAIDTDLFGSMTESRLLEYRAFKNPALAEDLRRKGVEPVGFEALSLHSVSSER
jgi:chitin disaccharide deacetylase